MSLSSALNAGVAGLLANSTKLSTISDNIANSQTPGYRRADVEFSALVNKDPRTTAFSAAGVRATPFRDVETSGSLQTTANPTDLAVAGNGMLAVTETDRLDLPRAQQPFLLTPTGSFDVDENGFLSTKTGLTLLGFKLDESGNLPGGIVRDGPDSLSPVQVSNFVNNAQQTDSIKLGVNLPAADTEADATPTFYESPLQYFDSVGRRQTLTIRYTPQPPAALGDPPTDTWFVEVFDSNSANPAQSIATVRVEFDDTNRGQIQTVTELDLTAAAPAGVPAGATVPADVAASFGAAAADLPTGYNATSYDPQTGTFTVLASDPDGDPAPPGADPADIDPKTPIEVFIGSDDPVVQQNLTDAGLTQLDAEFAPTNIIKNGAEAGTLSGLEVNEKGVLLGVYDTGQRVPLFQIPIADVPNMNGLDARNSQTFALTPSSGNVFLHDASTGPVGSLESATLQESSVDIARELTDLIRTQRAYSSNATVIQTADEMLQETTNIKR
jgi:flagellar hook protein FlgE